MPPAWSQQRGALLTRCWSGKGAVPKKDKRQLDNATAMRSEPTGPEAHLWYHLRAKRLNGIKFSNQVLIGPYTVDFPRVRESWRSNSMGIAMSLRNAMTRGGQHGSKSKGIG